MHRFFCRGREKLSRTCTAFLQASGAVTTSRPSGEAAISRSPLVSISTGSSSGTCFSRRRGQGGLLVAFQPASHCEHTAAAAPSFASSGPRMEGTRSGESSTRSTNSCDSGLWTAMHSSATACSAGLSEHSRAASAASTSCGSWPNRRLSRVEGIWLARGVRLGRRSPCTQCWRFLFART